MNLQDLINTMPFGILVVTVLLAMSAEAAKQTRPLLVSWISIAGLVLAASAALINFSADRESFGGMIRSCGLSNYFTVIFCFVSILTIIISKSYFKQQGYHRGEFYILLLFATLGMVLIASANDLMIIFLGIELMSVCLYVLAGLFRTRDRSNEAALKYFLLGAFSTGFLLYGIALIYGATGTTNLASLRSSGVDATQSIIFIVGNGLLLAGIAFKVAAVPFHMWAPDVYEGSPTPVTAFMTTGAKAAAFSAFIILFVRFVDMHAGSLAGVLAVIAAASMIVGNLVALAQSNIKRMFAYSSIAHAGYMLAGIAAGSHDGEIGVLYYLAAYSLMNLGVFAIIGLIERGDGENLTLDHYTGLGKRQPMLAACMALFMFTFAGVPPFAGFFGKYYVFYAAVKAHIPWLAIIGVLTSTISAYYYLRIVMYMYFRDDDAAIAHVNVPTSMIIVIVLCAVLVITIGLFPSLIIQTASKIF